MYHMNIYYLHSIFIFFLLLHPVHQSFTCLVRIEVLSSAYVGTSPRRVFCIHKDSNLRPLLKRPKSLPLEPTPAGETLSF